MSGVPDGGGATITPVAALADASAAGIGLATLRLLRSRWRLLVGIVALVVVPMDLVEHFLRRDLVERVTWLGEARYVAGGEERAYAVASVFWLADLLVVAPALGAILSRATVGVQLGWESTVDGAYRGGIRFTPSMLWVLLLVGAAVAGGTFLLVLPGLYLGIRLGLALEAVAIEGQRGVAALRRSWALTRGNTWRLVSIAVVAGLPAAVLVVLLPLPLYGLSNGVGTGAWLVRALASTLPSLLATPYVSVLTVLVYAEMRHRLEQATEADLAADLRDTASARAT